MAKVKYYYDSDTLSYRKIELRKRDKFRRLMVFLAGLILMGALLALPLTAHLTGRAWMQAELFAMTPDATALATLGLLLLAKGRTAVWLAVIPVAWCLVTGATLWVLEAPEALLLPAGAVLTITSMLLPIQRRG